MTDTPHRGNIPLDRPKNPKVSVTAAERWLRKNDPDHRKNLRRARRRRQRDNKSTRTYPLR